MIHSDDSSSASETAEAETETAVLKEDMFMAAIFL
jgi:hypothetical protein